MGDLYCSFKNTFLFPFSEKVSTEFYIHIHTHNTGQKYELTVFRFLKLL